MNTYYVTKTSQKKGSIDTSAIKCRVCASNAYDDAHLYAWSLVIALDIHII